MADNTIIHQGDLYVKSCGQPVANVEGGITTTCLKRRDHPGRVHEDYDGRRRHEIFGPGVQILEIPLPMHLPEMTPVTKEMVNAAWTAFIEPTQIAQDDQSLEIKTIASVLRAVNEGLPETPRVTEDENPPKESSSEPPDTVDAVVVDEVDGPCENCGKNEWTAVSTSNVAMLQCNHCKNTRVDR